MRRRRCLVGDAPEGSCSAAAEAPDDARPHHAAAIERTARAAADPRIDVPSIVGWRVDAARAQTRMHRAERRQRAGNQRRRARLARSPHSVRPLASVSVLARQSSLVVAAGRRRCEASDDSTCIAHFEERESGRAGYRGARPDGTDDRRSARSRGASRPHIGSVSVRVKRQDACGTLSFHKSRPPARVWQPGMPLSLVIADAPRVNPPAQVQGRADHSGCSTRYNSRPESAARSASGSVRCR